MRMSTLSSPATCSQARIWSDGLPLASRAMKASSTSVSRILVCWFSRETSRS